MSRHAIPALALALALVAPLPACSSPAKAPAATGPGAPHGPERRATVRIVSEPGAKRFQGVWLELEGGARWVIEYRARSVWRSFADRAVLVSGRCYEPQGQAIGGQHFEVHRMRLADPGPPEGPLLEVGPELRLKGVFAEVAFPPGSKRAGDTELVFRAEGGAEYRVSGTSRGEPALGERVAIDARPVEPNLAYAATTGGPRLWIFDVLDASAGEPAPGHVYGACLEPGGQR